MSFRPSRFLLAASLLAIALTLVPAQPRAATKDEDQFAAIVRVALANAPDNFAHVRTVPKTSDDEAYAKGAGALAAVCKYCRVTDEFADGKYDEKWVVQWDWRVPASWSSAQMAAYAQRVIEPLAAGAKRSEGTREGSLWTYWFNKSKQTFVYIETQKSSSDADVEIRVGHYLPKNVHYAKFGRPLTPAQRDDLAKAVRNLVQIGTQNISSDFTSLRGKAIGKENDFFDLNIAFGDLLRSCNINEIKGGSGVTGKWIFECETPALTGDKSDILELIRTTIEGAQPYGYTRTADPEYLLTDDFRWDRSSDSSAITVSAYDYGSGRFSYTISIYHFTT